MFYRFRKWEIQSFLEPKSWRKYDVYWLLESSCFELFGDWKYGLFLSQEVDGKMIFTGYWEVLVLNFSVMGNTVFFSAKKLMERWYLRGVFELAMIFQNLGSMVFRAVLWPQSWLLHFSTSYQHIIKQLIYAQAFAFKKFYIYSSISTSLSHEFTIETPLTSKICRLAKFCKVDAWSHVLHFTGETRLV